MTTLLSSIYKRREAIKVYAQHSRHDLVDQYHREIEVLEPFVPNDAKEMSKQELVELVQEVIEESKSDDKAKNELNKIIKEVRHRAGLRAHNLGRELTESVREALGLKV